MNPQPFAAPTSSLPSELIDAISNRPFTLVAFLRFHSSSVTILYAFPNLHPAVTVRVIVKEKMTALFYSGNLCSILAL